MILLILKTFAIPKADILYYPFGFGKVKLWTACNDKLEKQDIWRISVKLSPKKFRDKNPLYNNVSRYKVWSSIHKSQRQVIS